MHIDYDDITFRPHHVGFYVALAVVLGAGLACLALGLQHHPGWLIGTITAIYAGASLVSRYAAGSVAFRGHELALYRGAFGSREITYPLWETRFEYRQTLFERALDAGVVIVHAGSVRFRCRIAQFRAFRRLAAERRGQLLLMPQVGAVVLPVSRQAVITAELEER